MISSEERKQIIVRLYKLIKESKMFDDHPDSRIREAAMNTEQKAFETSSSLEEYMAFMNSKMEKVMRKNKMEKKDINNNNSREDVSRENGREVSNNFRENINRNTSESNNRSIINTSESNNRSIINTSESNNRSIKNTSDKNFDRHSINTGMNPNPLEGHSSNKTNRINQNLNMNRIYNPTINMQERPRPGPGIRSNQSMNIPPTMYNTSPKPINHPYTTPLYNTFNQGQYLNGTQYPQRNIKYINQQQVNSDLQYQNEVNYDIYRRNSIHNNTFLYVNNINDVGNINRQGDLINNRPGDLINNRQGDLINNRQGDFVNISDIFESNRNNDINNIKRQNNLLNMNRPDVNRYDPNMNRHDLNRYDPNLNINELNRNEMNGMRPNNLFDNKMYMNPIRQPKSGDLMGNYRIRDQNDLMMNKRFHEISRSPDMRRLSGDMNTNRISQREPFIYDNNKNDLRKRNDPPINTKRIQTSAKRTLSSGNIQYQNGNISSENISYNNMNQSIRSPHISDNTPYNMNHISSKKYSNTVQSSKSVDKKPQPTQQSLTSSRSDRSYLNQQQSIQYQGKTVSSEYSNISGHPSIKNNSQLSSHSNIRDSSDNNQKYLQKTTSPQFILNPQNLQKTPSPQFIQNPQRTQNIPQANDIHHKNNIPYHNSISYKNDIHQANNTSHKNNVTQIKDASQKNDIPQANNTSHKNNVLYQNSISYKNDIHQANNTSHKNNVTQIKDVPQKNDIPHINDTSQSPSDLKSFIMSTKSLSLSPSDISILKNSLLRDIDIQNKCVDLSDKHNLKCEKFNDYIYRLNLQRKLLSKNFFFLTWREVDDMVDYIKRYYIDIKDLSSVSDRFINYEESIDNICSMFDSKKNQDNEWLFDLVEE